LRSIEATAADCFIDFVFDEDSDLAFAVGPATLLDARRRLIATYAHVVDIDLHIIRWRRHTHSIETLSVPPVTRVAAR
jgi:hypothetical protein